MGLTIFLYYLGIGFIARAAMYAFRRWRPSDIADYRLPNKQPTSLKMRLANIVLVPLAIVFFFILLWPVILSIELRFPWQKFKFWTDKSAKTVPWTLTDDEPEFKLTKADLLQKFTRVEIESNERFFDPLDAVPVQPFGHLYKVWLSFVDGLEPGCELWSFRGHWKTQYSDWQMRGYVALQGEKMGPFFLTSQRSMRET